MIEYATHISQESVWDPALLRKEPKLEAHGCCTCLQMTGVSSIGECQSCFRLVRPGATATLDRNRRGHLQSH